MKTINAVCLLAIFLFTSLSRADVTAELRFDFEDHTFNDAYNMANYSTFRVNRARLKIDSAIDDYFSYYIRLNLNSSIVVDPTATSNITNKSAADNTTDLLEFAYLNYKIGPELLLTMGKMGTLTGGMEGLHNGGDVYVYSQSNPAWGQYTGLGLTYFYHDHSLIAHLANQEVPYKDLTKGSSYAQKRLAWAVQYYGMFLDKSFHVIASYLNSKPHNSTLEQQDDSFLAVGVKYQQPDYYIELDQLVNTFKNKTTAGTTDSTTGIVASAAVKTNQFQTGLKYAADSSKISDVKSADYNTIGVFTEYHPFSEKEMNVHAAFNNITTRPAIGENKTEQQILVGIKYYFSAVKP